MTGSISTQSTGVTQTFETSTISGGILDRAVEDYRIHHPIISALLNFFGCDIKNLHRFKKCIKEAESIESQIIDTFNSLLLTNKSFLNLSIDAGLFTKEPVLITLVIDRKSGYKKTYLQIHGQVTDYLVLNPLKRSNDFPLIEMRIPSERTTEYTATPIGIANEWSQNNDKQEFTIIMQYAISLKYIQLSPLSGGRADDLLKRAHDIIHQSTGIKDVLRREYDKNKEFWQKLDPNGDVIPFIINNANNLLDSNYNSEQANLLNDIIDTNLNAKIACEKILRSDPDDRGGVFSLVALLSLRVLQERGNYYADKDSSFKQKQ